MKDAPKELYAFASSAGSAFSKYHSAHAKSLGPWQEFSALLQRFFAARMDVARTNCSRTIALKLLGITGYQDFVAFRDLVLEREESRKVSFDGQRDHSAHTVTNYLLGWYVREHSTVLAKALNDELTKRGAGSTRKLPFDSTDSLFGFVWQYVSLLHDVGYMFEGAIGASDLTSANDFVQIGLRSVRSYFATTMWADYKIRSLSVRRAFTSELGSGFGPPEFSTDMSLDEVRYALQDTGDTTKLVAQARNHIKRKYAPTSDTFTDTFALWRHQYERFGLTSMTTRIDSLERIFEKLILHGLPDPKIRVLDHGVCSGLLQFLISNYYYRMQAAAQALPSPTPVVAEFKKFRWDPAFWWSGIAWATAACALHNIQCADSAMSLDPRWPGPLGLQEDPLAYLGVLVDVLQEWDRYPVRPRRDKEPIQGHEVDLGHKRDRKTNQDKVRVVFREPNGSARAAKVCKELDRSLKDWTAIVEVSGT